MDSEKVSIIVPIYNVREYLCESLDSIIAQTYKNIECILVNDGSTDGSEKICEEYAARYPDLFHLVNKENGGLSDARNTGIENATGQYIFFLDSDDSIKPLTIEKLVSAREETQADVVLSNLIKEGKGDITILSPEDTIEKALYQTVNFNHTVCGHLFDIRIFKDPELRFRKGIWYEDMEMFPRIITASRNVAHLDTLLYNYRRKRSGSIMASKSTKLADGIDVATQIRDRFAGNPKLYPAAENRLFAVSCHVFLKVYDPAVRTKCRKVIRSLRRNVLSNSKGRMKDRAGALLSYLFI